MNMSYCRFHNTSAALADCIGVLINKNDTIESEEERQAAVSLIKQCARLASHFEDELFNDAADTEPLLKYIAFTYGPGSDEFEEEECRTCGAAQSDCTCTGEEAPRC